MRPTLTATAHTGLTARRNSLQMFLKHSMLTPLKFLSNASITSCGESISILLRRRYEMKWMKSRRPKKPLHSGFCMMAVYAGQKLATISKSFFSSAGGLSGVGQRQPFARVIRSSGVLSGRKRLTARFVLAASSTWLLIARKDTSCLSRK